MAHVVSIRQKEAKGLGHAVLMAKDLVGDEPFAVILPDDVIDAKTSCIKQMIDVYDQVRSSVLATMEIEGPAISAYGVLDCTPTAGNKDILEAKGMVEKPKFEDAPSKFAIIGRYVLTPAIFGELEQITPGAGGELQLTDGIKALLKKEKVYGFNFQGTRHDAGDKLGMLKATVEFALQRDDLGPEFREYLKTLAL
jgi:UTP--glucose-1-phosphate uridylyltransferase